MPLYISVMKPFLVVFAAAQGLSGFSWAAAAPQPPVSEELFRSQIAEMAAEAEDWRILLPDNEPWSQNFIKRLQDIKMELDFDLDSQSAVDDAKKEFDAWKKEVSDFMNKQSGNPQDSAERLRYDEARKQMLLVIRDLRSRHIRPKTLARMARKIQSEPDLKAMARYTRHLNNLQSWSDEGVSRRLESPEPVAVVAAAAAAPKKAFLAANALPRTARISRLSPERLAPPPPPSLGPRSAPRVESAAKPEPEPAAKQESNDTPIPDIVNDFNERGYDKASEDHAERMSAIQGKAIEWVKKNLASGEDPVLIVHKYQKRKQALPYPDFDSTDQERVILPGALATAYYPFDQDADLEMEGPEHDKFGHQLFALEDYMEDDAPYVSVAMDKRLNIMNGTPLRIPELERKVNQHYGAKKPIYFRVVDTGGHFTGKGTKAIDICTKLGSSPMTKLVNQKRLLLYFPKGLMTAEVKEIAEDSLHLNVWDKEYVLPYEKFPRFKGARAAAVKKVRWTDQNHLRWSSLGGYALTLQAIQPYEQKQ